jgi:hypothetical protein
MPIDYAQEALDLGNLFQQIARQMDSYIQQNITALSKDQTNLNLLVTNQATILSYSTQFFSLGDKITFGNDQQYFQRVDQAIAVINQNLHTIQQTDKWISFAASVISLGLSIVSGNGSGILTAAQGILGAFNVSVKP